MKLHERLDRYQRRHPSTGFALAVIYKYVDDQGAYLAALITYYGFLSLFPLLLVLSTVLGFILQGDPSAQQQVLHSALSQFPIIGDHLGDPAHIGGGTSGLIIGLLGALYGGLGVAQAIQNAMNTAWGVPRNSRPNPIRARGRSLLLLVTVGGAVLVTSFLSILAAGAGSLGGGTRALTAVGSVLINSAVFIVAFRVATARPVTARQVGPGAVLAAVIWQLLQTFGATYVGHVIKHASAVNSVFALVLGLMAFIFLAAVALVICVEINVVRVDQLYPRALLTPFTDHVDLTGADRRAYTHQAKAQRQKGFEEISVAFNDDAAVRGE